MYHKWCMLKLEFHEVENLLSVRQPCHGQSLFHCPRQVQDGQGALGQAQPQASGRTPWAGKGEPGTRSVRTNQTCRPSGPREIQC